MPIDRLFVSCLYRATLRGAKTLNPVLLQTCQSIAQDDCAGRQWCQENDYPGYTSYASLNDLAWRADVFATLQAQIDRHVQIFARTLAFDLGRRSLVCNGLWINILNPGGTHASHFHPHSVISGTYYVSVPAGAIKFEDPRLAFMMAAPPRKPRAPQDLRAHVSIAPRAGQVFLWESWLRHEVLRNSAPHPRLSMSFNYDIR